MSTDADILTTEDVARMLKVSPRTVRRLGIPCSKLGERTYRYLREEVLEWLARHRPGVRRIA